MQKLFLRKKLLNIRKLKYNRKLKINFEKIYNILKAINKRTLVVGGYFPVSHEIDCLELLSKLEKKKIATSLPVIKKNRNMQFYSYSYNDPLKISNYGIPEPLQIKKVYPNILLVPLVGFDDNLYRIGYGGGFYDKYIAKHKKKLLVIGLAFHFQKVSKIPYEKFDQRLDLVITNKKVFS